MVLAVNRFELSHGQPREDDKHKRRQHVKDITNDIRNVPKDRHIIITVELPLGLELENAVIIRFHVFVTIYGYFQLVKVLGHNHSNHHPEHNLHVKELLDL